MRLNNLNKSAAYAPACGPGAIAGDIGRVESGSMFADAVRSLMEEYSIEDAIFVPAPSGAAEAVSGVFEAFETPLENAEAVRVISRPDGSHEVITGRVYPTLESANFIDLNAAVWVRSKTPVL